MAWPVTGVAQERLTRLELAGLSLTSAEWLATMRCLESVDLSDNQLSDLPDVCASAAGLRHLNLSRNLLRRLPHWILVRLRIHDTYSFVYSLVFLNVQIIFGCCIFRSHSLVMNIVRLFISPGLRSGFWDFLLSSETYQKVTCGEGHVYLVQF